MAIIGNISLNNVIKLSPSPLSYQIYVNVVATSDSPVIIRRVYYDNVLIDTTNYPTAPSPIYNYGTVATPQIVGVGANTTGTHQVKIELENTGGDVQVFLLSLYLDTQSPTVHDFSLDKISL